jgi:hypothetical protein
MLNQILKNKQTKTEWFEIQKPNSETHTAASRERDRGWTYQKERENKIFFLFFEKIKIVKGKGRHRSSNEHD